MIYLLEEKKKQATEVNLSAVSKIQINAKIGKPVFSFWKKVALDIINIS